MSYPTITGSGPNSHTNLQNIHSGKRSFQKDLNTTHSQVALMQTALTNNGYNTHRADGKFDNNTLNAVKAFQRANGLTDDGYFGRSSLLKLEQLIGGHLDPTLGGCTDSDTISVFSSGGTYLGQGTVIGGKLYCRKQPKPKYNSWGRFENGTVIAIYSCSTSGWYETRWPVGGNNIGYVMSKYVSLNGGGGIGGTSINTASWSDVLAGRGTYRKESSGSAVCDGVKTLQQYLKDIGWGRATVIGSSSDLTVDGNFGSKTEMAVKNFQYECGLTQDGIVGSQTAGKLESAHTDSHFTTQKYYPLSESEWTYATLPSWVDEISLCARLICAEHSRNGYPYDDEDARAGIAKVLRNRKKSSINFNEVNRLKTFKAIIFGSGQFNPATGKSLSKKMARFVWRGAGNGIPWQQAINYATKLVNGQSISRAANVTNQLYFNGYTSKWSTTGKKDIVYYPAEHTKKFTAFFNK